MLLLLLILFPFCMAPLSWLTGRRSKRARDVLVILTGFAELGLAIASAFLGKDLYLDGLCGLGLHLTIDGFRAVYSVLLAFMWAMTLLFSPYYFAHHHNRNRYYFFQLLTLGATMGVFLASDLFTAFVFFEIMSFTSFPWVIQEETDGAIRAAKTYLAVAVIGGLAALMGLFLLWRYLGTLELEALYPAARKVGMLPVFYTAGGCILFGFGAKAGMFPVHIWLPKAHPVAPAPASAMLSGALTKSGVWGILAISCNLFRGDPAWGWVILSLGAVTMLLGAVLALFSVDLKRTLACSSMSQIGFILVGIGMMGLLGEENALAARGTVLHMVNHSCFKLALFLCAGVIFRNLHQLNLNDIRGFGRKKPFLMAVFLLGGLGIGGIPLLNGYVSKTLLHESIVEGAEIYGSVLTAVEWVFLFSGGLTLAYMTKLFVTVFVEKHPTRQAEFDAARHYLSRPAAVALALSALVIPVLGLSANATMNRIADLSAGFFHAGHLHHAVVYLSAENLKGAAISVAIGLAVYLLVVRGWMTRRGQAINRWPEKLDLEDLVYRPLLLRILPSVFGAFAALFGENRLTGRIGKGIIALGGRIAALFGENRLTGRIGKGIIALGGRIAALFGENRLSTPFGRGLLRGAKTVMHALSDSLDGFVLLLRRCLFRPLRIRSDDRISSSLSYRLGLQADRTAALFGKEKKGGRAIARRFYRARQSQRDTWVLISRNLSFALLMLVIAICAIFVYLLLI